MRQLLTYTQSLIDALFLAEAERKRRWFAALWLAGLLLVGVVLWAKFLNFGDIPMDYLDWAEISGPRLAFLQNAVQTGQLPLHVNESSVLRMDTDRLMSVADIILSPQILLLGVLSIGQFVLANVLILYAIGAAGLFWLRKRFRLSLFAFSALFLLFNFNGHILSHLSVGHANWAGGYLLFPWLVVLTFQLLDGEAGVKGWPWAFKLALLLFFMFLNGAFHPFAWTFMFFGLVGLCSWKHMGTILKGLVAAVLLSMVRILPIALESGQLGGEFITGYTTLGHLLQAMLMPTPPWESVNPALPFSTVGWWEFDLYIGLIGVLFLAFFGIVRWLGRYRKGAPYPALLLPLLGMLILSAGHIYQLVMLTHVPLLAGERVSSRIVSLPFVFLLIIAAIELQRWLDSARPSLPLQLASLGALLLMVNDQWLYIKLWQVTNVYPNMTPVPVDLSSKLIANHPDPAYTIALLAGLAVSTLTLAALILLSRQKSSAKRQVHRAARV